MGEAKLELGEEVRAAFDAGRPVVALESTVLAHGLPYPRNLEVARQLEATVRAAGAVPATIGVVRGRPLVGLDDAALELFARGEGVLKLSRRDIAYAAATGRHGATTVAATMALAHLAGIEVFATGGIGGVHRGARESWDVSADLPELARTPVLVVCAGAKSILDLPATLEYLETAGVPVLGLGVAEFPAFYSASSGLPLAARVASPADAAEVWAAHRAYGGGGGALLAVPPPADSALPEDEVEAAIARALARAEEAGVRGQAVTPFLLAAVAEETGDASLRANIALLVQNARIAAEVAAALVGKRPRASHQ
jgi:pseudouridylate synthase